MAESRNRWFRPTLGGWLTLTNAVAWLLLIAFGEKIGDAIGPDAVLFVLLPFTIPLATCMILPSTGPGIADSHASVVAACLIIGANCFVWGYGIEGIVNLIRRRNRPR